MQHDSWSIQRILEWTQDYLQKSSPESPRLDAELLLAHVLGCDRLYLYLNADQPLTEQEKAEFKNLIQKRARACPVAYLTGQKEFWSLPLEVNSAVLIPRPDTELLVERCSEKIKELQNQQPGVSISIFELGSGSGAIPLALCAENENIEITSVDCSEAALEVAQKNLERHENLVSEKNNHLKLICGNGFSVLDSEARFDFVISNPPYIPTQDIAKLQRDVVDFEPHLALDGGKDGLDFYRYLLEQTPSFLKPNGEMLLEIGFDQKAALQNLLNKQKIWGNSQFFKDLNGNDRVWSLRYEN